MTDTTKDLIAELRLLSGDRQKSSWSGRKRRAMQAAADALEVEAHTCTYCVRNDTTQVDEDGDAICSDCAVEPSEAELLRLANDAHHRMVDEAEAEGGWYGFSRARDAWEDGYGMGWRARAAFAGAGQGEKR